MKKIGIVALNISLMLLLAFLLFNKNLLYMDTQGLIVFLILIYTIICTFCNYCFIKNEYKEKTKRDKKKFKLMLNNLNTIFNYLILIIIVFKIASPLTYRSNFDGISYNEKGENINKKNENYPNSFSKIETEQFILKDDITVSADSTNNTETKKISETSTSNENLYYEKKEFLILDKNGNKKEWDRIINDKPNVILANSLEQQKERIESVRDRSLFFLSYIVLGPTVLSFQLFTNKLNSSFRKNRHTNTTNS